MAHLHFAEARKLVEKMGEGPISKEELLSIFYILEHGHPVSPKPSGPPMEVGQYEVAKFLDSPTFKVRNDPNGCLVYIKDGRLARCLGVNPSLGFALDDQGRVQLADGG